MATGRIGVTPTLGVRWSKAPAGGTTSLSGLDDNSVSLVYSVGYEQVYRNGVLLSRTNDYTATTGTTITLVDATIAGDIIEVFAQELVPLTDAISKGQFNAKGALLSATAASTPGVLAVGSNGQYLTANSSTSTGLEWSTLSAGGMTLLSTTSLSGATPTISGISGAYTDLVAVIYGLTNATANGVYRVDPNSSSSLATYSGTEKSNVTQGQSTSINLNGGNMTRTDANNVIYLKINNYANTTYYKPFQVYGTYLDTAGAVRAACNFTGGLETTSAITSLLFKNTGGNISTGTVLLYGVK
jgi:hypothetical protein